MKRSAIDIESFSTRSHYIWAKHWLVLTAGDMLKNDFNAMTVAWGSFGTMWGKPLAMVVVRPSRHTWNYMEKYDSFTLCAFPEGNRKSVQLFGSKSGRDCDKIAESGLTVLPSKSISSPGFDEAELIVECRKIYFDDINPAHFLSSDTEKNYPKKDYHRMYFGEIVAVSGVPVYKV